jgi:hypothetical protein
MLYTIDQGNCCANCQKIQKLNKINIMAGKFTEVLSEYVEKN